MSSALIHNEHLQVDESSMSDFDVIVIGCGHAGVEAAWAAAKLGRSVGLCTLTRETVAHMPCNPAVGGTAKGHLVREIDALGGLMGRAIDATGIQFKLLNRSRGPAVWSPRAQADKPRYGEWVRAALEAEPNIQWIIGRAGRILRRKRQDLRTSARGWAQFPLQGARHHDRHVPEWSGSRWARAAAVGPRRRAAVAGFGRIDQGIGLPLGPIEDRNAAAARAKVDRLRRRRQARCVPRGTRR